MHAMSVLEKKRRNRVGINKIVSGGENQGKRLEKRESV